MVRVDNTHGASRGAHILTTWVVLLMLGSGCAAQGRSPGAAATLTQSMAIPNGSLQTNWARVFFDGVSATPAAAKATGALPFDPVVPPFRAKLLATEVNNPATTRIVSDRSVGYLFRFPLGPGFPRDGRLKLVEKQATPQDDNFAAIVADPPGRPEDFKLITVGGRHALLIQGGGVGRVRMISNGRGFDFSGPDVTPEMVVALADQIP